MFARTILFNWHDYITEGPIHLVPVWSGDNKIAIADGKENISIKSQVWITLRCRYEYQQVIEFTLGRTCHTSLLVTQ